MRRQGGLGPLWAASCCAVLLVACGGGGGGGTGEDADALADTAGDSMAIEYGKDPAAEARPDVTPEPGTDAEPDVEPDPVGDEGIAGEPGPDGDDPGAPDEGEEVPPDAAIDATDDVPTDAAPEAEGDAAADVPGDEAEAPKVVDWCRLQWPIEVALVSGDTMGASGRVTIAGVTDLTAGVDAADGVAGEFGVGPDGSDPAAGGWTWSAAAANPDWDAAAAGADGQDEYETDFVAGAAGQFDFAFRFTADGGATWTYCDRDAGPGKDGSEDGYRAADAGAMTVTDPCDPNPCDDPPPPECIEEGGPTLKTFESPGACTVDGGQPKCDYPPVDVECANVQKVCVSGACDDPCDPNPCTEPPDATCGVDGHTRNGWASTGVCALDAGAVKCTYQAAISDCKDSGEVCDAGACVEPPDPCDPNPCTTPPDPVCDGDTLTTYAPLGNCTPDYVTAVCDYPPVQVDCTAAGKLCKDAACLYPTPAPGDLVITEYMAKSQANADPGEWIELWAPAPAKGFDLRGCKLTDLKDPVVDSHTFASSLPIEPGDYLVLAKSADPVENHGLPFDYAYSGFNLSNSQDEIVIECGGNRVDWIQIPSVPSWINGISSQLEPGKGTVENKDPANWCWSIPTYGTAGKHGTPGAENPKCRKAVDWCRFQGPAATTLPPDGEVAVTGRVAIAGITDLTAGIDAYLPIRAQAGRGPDGSNPATGWTWADATPTAAWDATAAGDPGRDEYGATLKAPVGAYDLAFRFSLDGGTTWTYCDMDAGAGKDGSQDGYAAANAASLLVDDPCAPNPCTTPGPATCDATGLKVIGSVTPGACTPNGLQFSCEYAPKVTDCPQGQVCADGACDDPCEPNPCTESHPPVCDADGIHLNTFPATGTCTLDGLLPKCAYVPIVTDCSETGRTCRDGACFGVVIPKPDKAGQVVITEVMARADAGETHDGEWFEVFNASDKELELEGCTILDDGTDSHVVVGTLVFAPGDRLVFARSADPVKNHGITYDYVYANFTLANAGDEIVLKCGDIVIDRVTWGDGVVVLGASAQLAPDKHDAVSNDDIANWCFSLTTYGTDNKFGTPRAANPACKWNVGWCRYQHPSTFSVTVGAETADIYGRVWVQGVTDRSNKNDAVPPLVAQVGFGPVASEPSGAGWTWVAAAPNPGWTASGDEANNDEYMGRLAPVTAGTWAVAYRFALDGGHNWTYCDKDMRGSGGADGSADGYQAANSGAMSVSDPCTPNPCLIPPAPTCDADGKTLVKKQPPVTCAVVDGNAQCNWTTATQDCSTVGICEAGACMPIPMPFKNEMIVTEFMARSDSGQSDKGEWVELYNNSGKRLNLGGCLLKDNGSNSYTIPSPMLVNAGAYLLFAQSGVAAENHALPTPDAVYSNFTLANTGDAIILNCAGVDVDKFVYTSNAAAPLGKSFQLDPTKYDATLNDTVGNWCASSTTFGTAGSCSRYQTPDAPTDCFGTPKAANVSCGLP